MEIKQIAESITRVTHAKKVVKPSLQEHNRSSTNTDTVDDSEFFGTGNDGIGNLNRPKILRNILKDIEKNKSVKHRSSKQMATNSLLKNKQETEYLFRVEFD